MNKTGKFHIKIPNGCWENGKKLGIHFFLPSVVSHSTGVTWHAWASWLARDLPEAHIGLRYTCVNLEVFWRPMTLVLHRLNWKMAYHFLLHEKSLYQFLHAFVFSNKKEARTRGTGKWTDGRARCVIRLHNRFKLKANSTTTALRRQRGTIFQRRNIISSCIHKYFL